MSKSIVFSTDDLPEGLDEKARASLWHELYMRTIFPVDVSYLRDRPLSVRFEFAPAGALSVGKYSGTISRLVRRPVHLGAEEPKFILSFNGGPSTALHTTTGRDLEFKVGSAVLLASDVPASIRYGDANSWSGVVIPKARLLELVPDAEDMTSSELARDTPALLFLRRYVDLTFGGNGFLDDPALSRRIETTLLDLIALALGATRDVAELARMRGMRAARLQEVLSLIRAGFADPAFSTDKLARKLGISRRYVNDLLYETGATFSERILELRLQKAHAMLADRRHDRTKVSDIALACGFNEVSYFNRCFRARFGATPTQYRGGNGGEG
jgi:AraC-like DNA-binding protein